MDKFIKTPNIPEGKVTMGVVDGRARKSLIDSLEKLGIEIILTGECTELYKAVSYHPDMLIHHVGGKDIIASPNAPLDLVSKLIDHGFNIIRGHSVISRKYPLDTAYNVARIGEYAVCNAAYSDRVLLDYLASIGVKILNVGQGYAKCSICVIDDSTVITSDEGIYRILTRGDIDVLKITPGYIELPGLNYGFIGGASGLISKDTVAFTGNILVHPDFKKIEHFLSAHGKQCKPLDNQALLDVGSFIPLKEHSME